VPEDTWNKITANLFTIKSTVRLLGDSIAHIAENSRYDGKEAYRLMTDINNVFPGLVELVSGTSALTDI
jgi:hypothetical protein